MVPVKWLIPYTFPELWLFLQENIQAEENLEEVKAEDADPYDEMNISQW